MAMLKKRTCNEHGFSLTELLVVICGAAIIAGIGVPVLGTIMDSYGLVLTSQQITTELQYARMRAVSSNEPFRVHFEAETNSYHIDTGTGTLHAGPFALPPGTTWNAGDGDGINFPGDFVTFLPTGNLPSAGDGSAGRVSLINRAGLRIDISVSTAGQIRASSTYK